MDSPRPRLPDGRAVRLPGRGTTWVYDSRPSAAGGGREAGARPAVLLLHGWTSTAALNWFRAFPALAEEYRVIALDQRGHGRGIRSRIPFRLEDCAADAAALVEVLGTGPVIPVGYSMGGPVAQLMWRNHRELVSGLVLCATAARFATRQEFTGALGVVGLGASMALSFVPASLRRQGMSFVSRNWTTVGGMAPWAIEEWQRNDPAVLIQGGLALSKFDSRSWIGQVDVPTAVIVTTQDSLVSPRRQWRLAQRIPDAVAYPIAGDHRACVEQARLFVPALLAACQSAEGGEPGAMAADPASAPLVEPSA